MEEMLEAVPMAGDFANQVIYPRQTETIVINVIGCYRHNCDKQRTTKKWVNT